MKGRDRLRVGQGHLALRSALVACALVAVAWTATPVSAFEASSPADCPPAAAEADGLRPLDELWLVSTRCLGCPGAKPPEFDVRRFEPGAGWQADTLWSLGQSRRPDQVTAVYVHGNRMEYHDAVQRGWQVYHLLAEGTAHARPLRMVIWS